MSSARELNNCKCIFACENNFLCPWQPSCLFAKTQVKVEVCRFSVIYKHILFFRVIIDSLYKTRRIKWTVRNIYGSKEYFSNIYASSVSFLIDIMIWIMSSDRNIYVIFPWKVGNILYHGGIFRITYCEQRRLINTLSNWNYIQRNALYLPPFIVMNIFVRIYDT